MRDPFAHESLSRPCLTTRKFARKLLILKLRDFPYSSVTRFGVELHFG